MRGHTRLTIAAGFAAIALATAACAGDDANREGAAGDTAATGDAPMRMMDSTGNPRPASGSGAAQPQAAADAPSQAALDELAELGAKPVETLTPQQARTQPSPADAVKSLLGRQGKPTTPTAMVPGVTSVDRTIAGAAGQIPARIYTPAGAGPFPVIVYYHGGGWVIANKDVYDGGARGLAKAANAVVVSVDYRLAPEHKFPAQHDDALAAYEWVLKNAASIKGDPNRVATAGESAGGNLAVAVAMLARDKGVKLPVHVLSVYPIAQPDTTTASYVENANAKPLSRAGMSWFAKHAMRTPADLKDPRVDLVHANLKGLPPVSIVLAQIDPLRDDGVMLEQALRTAGVPVELKRWDGVTHEFFGMAAVIPKAMDAQAWAGDRLKGAFSK